MFFPVRKPWLTKPPPGTKIDLSNPLSAGLEAAWLFDQSGQVIDVLGKHHSTTTLGDPALVGTPQGIAVHLDNTTDRFEIPDHPDLDFTDESFAFIYGVTPQQTTAGREFFEKQPGSGNNVIQLRTDSGDFQWFLKETGGILTINSSPNFNVGQYYNLTCGFNAVANDMEFWVDGVSQGTLDVGGQTDFNSAATFKFGSGNGGQSNAYHHYCYVFRRHVPEAEAKAFHENPWRGFEPRLIWPTIASGDIIRSVGQAIENNTAQPIQIDLSVPVGQAVETNIAQTITPNTGTVIPVGQAVETNTAQPIGIDLSVPVGQAIETNIAQSITPQQGLVIPVGQAIETNIAQAITPVIQNKTVTVPGIVGGENLSDLSYTVYDGYDISVSPILKQGAGEATDGSGNLVIDLNGTDIEDGDPLSIVITDYTTSPVPASGAAVLTALASVV